ncbi:MAG TPA: histidine kinase [Thermoanaerobaculia bacterium]
MRRWWIPAFWTVFALLSALQSWLAVFTHGHSFPKIVAYHLLVWAAWAAFTPLVVWLVARFPPRQTRNLLVHVLAALVLSLAHVAYWVGLSVGMQPYDDMGPTLFGSTFIGAAVGRLPFEVMIYIAAMVFAHAMTLERTLGAARLHALELQIQPHFLFNTLNAISSLVRARQNAEAVEVIAGLSDLLRYTLDHAGAQRVPLEQETAMLQRYLGIQRVRFPDRLDVSIDVEDEARRAAVPTLILQPLAENAIRHGIARVASAGRVEVRAFRRDESLEIEMFNTGSLNGERRGIGLTNTIERLRQLYGDAHRFELCERDGGVVAAISIPWSVVT